MSLSKSFKDKLPVELWQQVQDALGDDFNWDYVPRTRLNTVIGQRNEFKAQLEGTTGGSSTDTDSPSGAISDKSKQVDTEAEIDKIKAQYESQMLSMKARFALTEKLRETGCRNPDLLLDKFSFDKLKFDESGTVSGYEDDLKKWQTSAPYLFTKEGEDIPSGTGMEGTNDPKKAEESKVDALLSGIFGDLPK